MHLFSKGLDYELADMGTFAWGEGGGGGNSRAPLPLYEIQINIVCVCAACNPPDQTLELAVAVEC